MKKNRNNRVLSITAFAFILFLLIVSNQANLRKSLAVKVFSYGNYYFNGGAYDLGKAESRFKMALFFDSHLQLAHYQLGRIYFVENKSKEALKEIDAELALNSENMRSYYIRGLINGYSADFQVAIDDFTRFVAWAPNEWAGYNDLAWAYYKNENYDQAKETAEAGLKLFPDNAWLLNGLGAAELSLSNFSESQKTMEKVSALADKLSIKDWIRAYPGNDPSDASQKLDEFRDNVSSNLALAKNQIAFGGNFAAACASSECTPGEWDAALCRACSGIDLGGGYWGGRWDATCSNYGDGANHDAWCACDARCGTYSNNDCISCGACGSCADSRYKWCTGGVYGSGQCLQFSECQPTCTPSCGACSVSCGWGTQSCTAADCSAYTQSCYAGACVYCGDGSCNNGENCSTCPGDCGACACVPTNSGCAASTCVGSSCWDDCSWIAGTKDCTAPTCGSLPPGSYAWCPGDGSTASFSGERHLVSGSGNCSSANCEYYALPVSSDCGSANGKTYCQQPTNNLCDPNSNPAVSANGSKWEWTCGSDSCAALKSCAYQEVSPN